MIKFSLIFCNPILACDRQTGRHRPQHTNTLCHQYRDVKTHAQELTIIFVKLLLAIINTSMSMLHTLHNIILRTVTFCQVQHNLGLSRMADIKPDWNVI